MHGIAFCGGMTATGMADATDQLINVFVANLMASGVPVRRDDNSSRLQTLESKLPRRLPISFTSLLSRYSFPSFDAGGISFFSWESANTDFSAVVPPAKGSLSELLLLSGYLQIGRPNTGKTLTQFALTLRRKKKNREYRDRTGRPRRNFMQPPSKDSQRTVQLAFIPQIGRASGSPCDRA